MASTEIKDYPIIRLNIPETKPNLPGVSVLDISADGIVDSSGIPLASDRANPKLTEGIDWEYQGCPYKESSSRYPNGESHATPMSGLERRRLRENYPQILSIAENVRRSFIENTRVFGTKDSDRPLDSIETRGVLRALSYLPHYLVFRGEKPIKPAGEMDSSIVILANAAAGALGGLEAYLGPEEDKADLKTPPDAEGMISASEELGTLIGDKTVCVASPEQMKHFIEQVVRGPEQYKDRFDINPFLDFEKETMPLFVFSQEAYRGHTAIEQFRRLDYIASENIKRFIKRKRNPRRNRAIVGDFLKVSKIFLGDINLRSRAVNVALGRMPVSPLSLERFESEGFSMPKYIRTGSF